MVPKPVVSSLRLQPGFVCTHDKQGDAVCEVGLIALFLVGHPRLGRGPSAVREGPGFESFNDMNPGLSIKFNQIPPVPWYV